MFFSVAENKFLNTPLLMLGDVNIPDVTNISILKFFVTMCFEFQQYSGSLDANNKTLDLVLSNTKHYIQIELSKFLLAQEDCYHSLRNLSSKNL